MGMPDTSPSAAWHPTCAMAARVSASVGWCWGLSDTGLLGGGCHEGGRSRPLEASSEPVGVTVRAAAAMPRNPWATRRGTSPPSALNASADKEGCCATSHERQKLEAQAPTRCISVDASRCMCDQASINITMLLYPSVYSLVGAFSALCGQSTKRTEQECLYQRVKKRPGAKDTAKQYLCLPPCYRDYGMGYTCAHCAVVARRHACGGCPEPALGTGHITPLAPDRVDEIVLTDHFDQ